MGSKTGEIKRRHEFAVAKDFANYISTHDEVFNVIETPDPPDAILKSNLKRTIWVEIRDVFRAANEAKSLMSSVLGNYKRSHGLIVEPDLGTLLSLLTGIEDKV